MSKSRRNLRGIIILSCVCVVLAAAYFIITATENPAAAGVLFRLGSDSIARVTIDNQYGSFMFEQQDGQWIVESQGSYRTNPEKISLLLACLEDFKIDRMLPEEKADYGFDTPQAEVSVTTDGGRTYSFTVGNDAIQGISVYIKSGDDIMLTSSGMTSQLTGSLAAYRAKDVLMVDPAAIRSIDYYVDGEKTLSVTNTDYQNWSIQYPFEAQARRVVMNELVSRLRSLVIAGYVDSGNAPDDTGLEDAATGMVLTDAAGVQQKLEFGAVNGTLQYVRMGGKDDIVQLYAADLDFSELTPQSVMYIAPLNIGITQVKSIAIEAGGETDTLTLKQNGDDIKAYLNGNELSQTDFVSLYYKYVALNADGFDTGKPTPGECVATCTTTLLDGETVQLSLCERDADTLYLYLNGELLTAGQAGFFMPVSSLTELLYRLEVIKNSL